MIYNPLYIFPVTCWGVACSFSWDTAKPTKLCAVKILLVSLCFEEILVLDQQDWSECASVQTDLRPCWAHIFDLYAQSLLICCFSVQVEKFVEKSEEESLSLAPCSAFQRKLTYQAVNAKYALRSAHNKSYLEILQWRFGTSVWSIGIFTGSNWTDIITDRWPS